MAESNPKFDSYSSINEDPNTIKLNKHIHFTNEQIENLLKIQSFINLEPHNCILLVSSTLKLENMEVNNINFWLADTLAVIVKSIQRTRMSVLQGTTVVRWILHYVSLVIGDEKLSKTELFENLRKCIKIGLANAEEFIIPLPNCTTCPKYVALSVRNSIKSRKSENSIPVTAVQIATFVLNAIRDVFWDNFKYTVIQIAFNVNPIEVKKMEYSIKHVEPLNQSNDDIKSNDENGTKVKSDYCCECRGSAIMDRYFLRNSDRDPPSTFTIGLQRSLCPVRGLDVSDDVILPLSAANLTEDTKKYMEKLRIENRQKRASSNWNTKGVTSRARSVSKNAKN